MRWVMVGRDYVQRAAFKRFAKTQGTTCGRSVDCGLCHDFYMQLFSLKIWEITLASRLLPLQQ